MLSHSDLVLRLLNPQTIGMEVESLDAATTVELAIFTGLLKV